MQSFVSSNVSSQAVKDHGDLMWDELVRSCNATKNWADDEDDEDFTVAIPDATPKSDVSISLSAAEGLASAKGQVSVTSETNFLDEKYQSFDWAADDEATRSDSLSPQVCSPIPSLDASCDSDNESITSLVSIPVGRYMPTIMEEDEDEVEEICYEDMTKNEVIESVEELILSPFEYPPSPTEAEILALLDDDSSEIVVNLPKVSRLPKYRASRTPKPSQNLRCEHREITQHPTTTLISDLFEIPNRLILKRLGLLTGYLRRTIVVNLPSPNQNNLDILALVSSRQPPSEPASPSGLDILADMAADTSYMHIPDLSIDC